MKNLKQEAAAFFAMQQAMTPEELAHMTNKPVEVVRLAASLQEIKVGEILKGQHNYIVVANWRDSREVGLVRIEGTGNVFVQGGQVRVDVVPYDNIHHFLNTGLVS